MKKKIISIILAAVMCISVLSVTASAEKTLGAQTTTSLNLRKGAGTGYSIRVTMPKGAELIVLSSSNGWSKVMYKNMIGYASSTYLKSKTSVSGDFGTGTITGSDVRMRKGAGTSYSILGTYSKGTKMTVTGASGNWYAVKYNSKSGYVSADYMSISETTSTATKTTTTSTATYQGTVTGTDVRFRTGAGTGYTALGTVAKGSKLSITGSESGWYKFLYQGKTYYISGQYVKLTVKTPYSSTKDAEITDNGVFFRMGPATSFNVMSYLSKGTKLTLLGEYNGWYAVKVGSTEGYVYKTYVKTVEKVEKTKPVNSNIPEPETKLSSSGTVTGDEVRLREGPGTSYATLGYYNSGNELTVKGKTGNWYRVSISGKEGYMSADYVSLGSTQTNGTAKNIAELAKSYIGTPYVYGGASPKGFDCSGLVYYCYGQYGYSLRRGATGQFNNNGTSVSKSDLRIGDLVFFSDSVDPIGHVGMYIGDGKFVHASSGKGCVTTNNLSDYYYKEHYAGAKRIIK